MTNLLPEADLSFRVGDTLTLSWLWTKANKSTVRVLTGYAAWVQFWYLGADPHVVRAASVDGANGLVIYDLLGDEYALNTTVFAQARVYVPDWYVDGAAGQSGLCTSCDIVSFIVRPMPS